uniref:Coenzyme F390 synthetase n=1 Tax=Thermosporothrix sp. COM3 TaxID=2490863 RepID=A0A455SEY0_9CHLR|nr:coenzyme F390 synthetase [Thermosporothrix sp. COM3]
MIALETASRAEIEAHQLARLQEGLKQILRSNRFYQRKYADMSPLQRLTDMACLPFTAKRELIADQERYPAYGSNLTFPLAEYVRLHHTSGTTGRPLRMLDTAESWSWWARCWGFVYRGAGVTRDDVLFLAFGFGPFIGFWAAHEGAHLLGALTVPGGSMDSLQRLRLLRETGATVLVCTPSYALRLAEVARENGMKPADFSIRVTIHAGEPGASIPATRERIEQAWQAQTYDHAGMTEMGAYGFSCSERGGMHVNESEFIAEILDPVTGKAVREGETGELILTNLGRWGMPALRYRTGDLVRHGGYRCPCGRSFLFLPGGVLGRIDDMLIVRGTNVYPSALADVLHRFPEVAEYRIIVTRVGTMDEIALQIESATPRPEALQKAVQQELHAVFGLRFPVEVVSSGSLPRFELKARRVVDRRPRV